MSDDVMKSGKVNVADRFHGVGITKILPEALKECHSERIYIALKNKKVICMPQTA